MLLGKKISQMKRKIGGWIVALAMIVMLIPNVCFAEEAFIPVTYLRMQIRAQEHQVCNCSLVGWIKVDFQSQSPFRMPNLCKLVNTICILISFLGNVCSIMHNLYLIVT